MSEKRASRATRKEQNVNKSIRERLDSWDLKSLLLTVFILLVGAFVIFYFSDLRDRLRNNEMDELKGRAKAEIISIEPVERITQGKKGTRIFTDSYSILYTYTVNRQEYQKTDIVPVSKKNDKLITRILGRRPGEIFWLGYDLSKPGRSLLMDTK